MLHIKKLHNSHVKILELIIRSGTLTEFVNRQF